MTGGRPAGNAGASPPLGKGAAAGGAQGAAANNEVFMTRAAKARAGVEEAAEPLAMDRVRTLHTQLTSVVGALNDKVSTILKKQESEFLRAYRAHMYSVQKELAQLRAKADDAALQLAKNEKIRQLEGALPRARCAAGWLAG